ncbi:hypothetical protein F5Y12DRAFT_357194 [Xylaria sp. FL1777]|nr:hypothetical protein F5Y12DRAFT_357194 [Xylaria sp. FL1777]
MSVVGGSSSRLSPELWLEILRHLVLSGAPTTMAIQSRKIELRPHVLEYRWTLWAACQVSRQVGACARIYLYQSVLINSCKELFYVFRTLRTVPELRALVRSFSWTGTLPRSDIEETEYVDSVFASLPPPVTEEDALLHQFLDADNLAEFRVWRLLGVVLAIIPKLTTLFLSLGGLVSAPGYGLDITPMVLGPGVTAEAIEAVLRSEQRSYEFLAIRALLKHPILTSIGYPLLPELQFLILDHVGTRLQEFNNSRVIGDLSELCPQLQYIQTKASVGFGDPPARSTSRRKLLIRGQLYTIESLPELQAAYPNLTSLRIVVSGREHEHTGIYPFVALAKLQHLQYLSMTTPHDIGWTCSDPHIMLSDYLRRMESLQHLRVDFIWLAARNNPSRLLHVASLLPPSIRSLHLLDYWAVSMTSTHRERHPVFPDNMSPADFMYTVLENLLQSCSSAGLTSLTEVKLSSREYAHVRRRLTGVSQWLNQLIWRFSRAGIRLTLTGLEEAREEEEGWWLNLD